jgi:chemotaxis signal transduction protein
LRLRDRLLPLVNLHDLLALGETHNDDTGAYIVVAQVGANSLGIIVDRVFAMTDSEPTSLWPRPASFCARTSSTTLICGIAKRSPPTSTISADTIASVSGILMVNVVPAPGVLFRSMVPPIFSIYVLPAPNPRLASVR